MGALFNGVCYPDLPTARQAACSASSATWGQGASVFTVECASSDFTGPSYQLCRRENGGECSVLTYAAPTMPECDFHGGADFAVEWMYLVLPVMVSLWGIKRLIDLFSTNREDA